jgi:replicative DNA helicase
MQSAEAAMLTQDSLAAEDFYDPAHAAIYDAMLALLRRSRPVDLVTLDAELTKLGQLEGIGGAGYLIELSQYAPTTANVSAYIRIVGERSTLRKLISASDAISGKCYRASEEAPAILEFAEKLIYDIAMRKGGDVLKPISPVLVSTFNRIEELSRNKGKINGVPTGYTDLDNLLTGMHMGEFILVAGRPAIGKTALGMNIVENAAIRYGVKAAVFSLEMPAEQLVMRMLCSQARVSLQSVRQGALSDNDWLKLTDAMPSIARSHIYIDDTGGITVPAIRSKARRLQMERGLDLIMIDYLQLMSGTGRFSNRQEEVSSISRSLKGLAQELSVPVLVMSQLSRAPAGRSSHVPILSDIRDSGAIEQDADVVMFIHRENYYDPATEKGNIADIIVAKQRNGPLATIELAYIGDYTRFVNFKQN